MFVRDYMTRNPITVDPEATFPQALNVLRKNHIRHLPVMKGNKLVGIIVEKDLLSNQPSQATTLSVFEIYSLLEKLLVRQMMSRPVITVEGNCPIEEAARIMVERKISCLPVMEDDKLVGIITETDIFKVLVEVLGGEEKGFRLTFHLPNKVGELAAISSEIARAGGNIIAVTTYHHKESDYADKENPVEMMIKEKGADKDALNAWLKECGIKVADVRNTEKYQPLLFD
jgi:acetoin utilization protein AcuB